MRFSHSFLLILSLFAFLASSCQFSSSQPEATPLSRDQVYRTTLPDIRLGDGVPLGLDVSIRWHIAEPGLFFSQFDSTEAFNTQILRPRSQEIAALVSNSYPSVDSIFGSQRFPYLEDLRTNLSEQLEKDGIAIKEIIFAEIIFPPSYTMAKEKVGLKEQELAAIQQQSLLEVARAQANKQQAEANGQVAIAEAQAQGRLEKIQAQIEESRRKRQLGQAETEKQVAEKRAESDARRQVLLAQADLQKQHDLKKMEVQHQREMEMVGVEKIKALDEHAWNQQMELAKLCSENPSYAAFLVNKELASKVQIAVLPGSGESQVFGDFLQQNLSKSTAQK